MNFYIQFENASIDKVELPNIISFSFTSSLFKFYSGAKLTLNDPTFQFNNELKVGMKVNIVFYDENTTYINKMQVFSIEKLPSAIQNYTTQFNLILVPQLYFENSVLTSSYYGNTSQIIEEILKTQYSNVITDYDITQTVDYARRRYQIAERSQDFMQRIMKYGIKDSLPVYAYFSPQGKFNLHGVSDMMGNDTQTMIYAQSAVEMGEVPANSENYRRIIYTDCVMNTTGKKSYSEIKSVYTTDHFSSASDIPTSLLFKSIAYKNTQSLIDYPTKEVIYNWNVAPSDAFAISAKTSFEDTVNIFNIEVSFNGLHLDELAIGKTVYLILPNNPSSSTETGNKINLGEGKYMVTKVLYSYKDNFFTTTCNMIQVA